MPDLMWAMVQDAPGAMPRSVRVDRPVPRAGEVSIDVVATGAGLTLEMARQGGLGATFPRILGHELAGRIREVGAGVSAWNPGDRVAASFYLTCGDCDPCRRGRETLCTRFQGFVGAAIDGGFAETVRLPARNIVRVPDVVPLSVAGVVADAVATPVHIVNSRIDVPVGCRAAVVGAGGGLGVHCLQVIRSRGAHVVGVETSADKRARLYEAGLADEIVERLAPHSDQFGGMDIVIDCVGSTGSLAAAAAALAPGGALVVLGAAPGATLEMPGIDMILREIAVIGTRYTSRAEIAAAFQLVASGHVRPIVGARFDLARLPDAFEAINANTVFGRIVVDVSEE